LGIFDINWKREFISRNEPSTQKTFYRNISFWENSNREYLFPDPNPKYTDEITILNTAPKFGDLWPLFQYLIIEAILSWRAVGRQQSDLDAKRPSFGV